MVRLWFLTAFAFVAVPTGATADCTCRAKGVVAEQGEVVCLATPRGVRLARCDKVLNNSSWTFLQAPCPILGERGTADRALDRLAAAAPRHDRR